MIRLKCPGCGVSLKIPDSFAGKKSPCPKCRRVVQIPAAEEPEVEEEELLQKAEDEAEEEEAPEAEEPEEKPAPKRGAKKPVRPAADEDEEEEAPEDEDEEEEEKPAPKKKGKKPVRRAADEDDEDEEEEEEDRPRRKKGRGAGAKGRSFLTYKKISGMVGVVLGLGALGYGLATGFTEGWAYIQIVCAVFGALLVAAGAYYIVMP